MPVLFFYGRGDISDKCRETTIAARQFLQPKLPRNYPHRGANLSLARKRHFGGRNKRQCGRGYLRVENFCETIP